MVRPMKRSEVEKNRNSWKGIRIKNSKMREKKFRLSSRQLLLITIMIIVFMGSGISYVWSNFEGTQIGYDLSRLRKDELKLKDLNLKLKLELATLKSPQYLELAIRGSGLRETSPEQIIILP
ncbi:MAG: hypothetical protein SV375_04290 [Thermodesulfobacteriota bacterium]|nr:hypothetical protein [Thermodesulfobacteriota bacterium]